MREQIMIAIGSASMCWEPKPGGVFDDRRAQQIGEGLISAFERKLDEKDKDIDDLCGLFIEDRDVSLFHTLKKLVYNMELALQNRPLDGIALTNMAEAVRAGKVYIKKIGDHDF